MIKRSPDADQEAEHCQKLGEHVCPKIFMREQGTYIMEYLQPSGVLAREDFPRAVHWLLEEHVWHGAARMKPWLENFETLVGKSVPEEIRNERWVLTHGDPTIANVMFTEDGWLRLIDPRVAPYIPSMQSVDKGKIYQSMLGWETVLAHEEPSEWRDPPIYDNPRVLWWTSVHARRILLRELRKPNSCQTIVTWAAHVEGECGRASGL